MMAFILFYFITIAQVLGVVVVTTATEIMQTNILWLLFKFQRTEESQKVQ
jgi:hypothetical protein